MSPAASTSSTACASTGHGRNASQEKPLNGKSIRKQLGDLLQPIRFPVMNIDEVPNHEY